MQDISFHYVDGGVVAARGFLASGISAGIKNSGARDLALIIARESCPAAAVFTRNSMAAAPVVVSRDSMEAGTLKACIINSGNANACTGVAGLADARATGAAVAKALDCTATEVVVSSTGVIGVPLPLDVLLNSIPEAVAALDNASGDEAAQAIMTTDTFVKQVAVAVEVDGRTYTVGGMAKGSGMIMPNMATMLGVITCDAPLTTQACDTALRTATGTTFNRITVDSDTSTNDMVLLMASGAAGGEPIDSNDARYGIVSSAIHEVCGELARM
ncbi:MAG: bifunctional ornithine acetyltransferase/N-acetylglutamate synthase, partial [Coriobacteriia bacterium]